MVTTKSSVGTRLVQQAQRTRPDQMPGYLVPNDRFYIRSHAPTPYVDVVTWTLSVEGDGVHRRSPTPTTSCRTGFRWKQQSPGGTERSPPTGQPGCLPPLHTAPVGWAFATSGVPGARRARMGTLMPRLTSQTLAGQEVQYPMIMPTCMRNQ